MREYKVGDPVLLHLRSPGSVGITQGLMKYKDRRFRISKIVYRVGTGATNRGVYYELKGCVTEFGIPYAVLEDWFQLIREVKHD